jgi:predicted nucleic acid-binding protein
VPLFPDATALIALAAADLVHLLPSFDGEVHIGEHVRAEVRSGADALQAGIVAGWLRVEPVDDSHVMELQNLTGLDAGECEVILLAGMRGGRGARVLIDEATAFETVRRFYPDFELISLPQLLTLFERDGRIASATDLLNRLIDDGDYAWAPEVRQHYVHWRERQ